MLEGFGYRVVVAGTGEQALEIFDGKPEIDLILMDIDLGSGRLSGTETAIRILEAHQVPVLFLSSHAEPEVVARTEKISTYGYVVKSTDGTILDASIKIALRLFQANVRLEAEKEHLQTTLDSIGDARRHQDYVIEESQRAASIGSYRGDFTRNIWESSVEMRRIFGLGDSIPVNLTIWLALVHPEDQAMVWRHMQEEVIGLQKPFDKEYRILRESDGETRWMRGLGTVTFDPSGVPLTMIGTIQDITERKAIADRLREAQEQLALFMRHSPIHAYLKEVNERESRVLFASESFADLIGIPGSQITGKTMEELFPPDFASKMTRDDWAVVSGGHVLALDEEFNGRHYSTIKFPITQGAAKLLAGYSIEITERKHAEDKIKVLLEDKERLLEEVHHRIKNVLYAIKGLLTLQAAAESGAEGRATLLEAANRVQSMMMLYDKLQKSSDYLSVSTQPYLSTLAVAIVANFSGNIPVTLEKSIDDCVLSAEKCQPLGLILNELLTNVMRHAFVGKSSGTATVTFRVDEGRGVLVVQDDGQGLPDSIDFNNSHSLGLRLVSLLSKQIGGTVRTERGNGTKVIVEFPKLGVREEGK